MFVVRQVVAICNGCRAEKKIAVDPPLRSAGEFIEWQRASVPALRCSCGYRTCDLKLILCDQN